MPEHNRRKSEQTRLGRWYSRRMPEVHIAELITLGGLLMGALAAYVTLSNTVDAHTGKNREFEAHFEKLDEAIAVQTTSSARIEQKVDYIRQDVQAMRRGQ